MADTSQQIQPITLKRTNNNDEWEVVKPKKTKVVKLKKAKLTTIVAPNTHLTTCTAEERQVSEIDCTIKFTEFFDDGKPKAGIIYYEDGSTKEVEKSGAAKKCKWIDKDNKTLNTKEKDAIKCETNKVYTESEKRRETQRRYRDSEKWRETQRRYTESGKWREAQRRYRDSEKWRETQRRYRDSEKWMIVKERERVYKREIVNIYKEQGQKIPRNKHNNIIISQVPDWIIKEVSRKADEHIRPLREELLRKLSDKRLNYICAILGINGHNCTTDDQIDQMDIDVDQIEQDLNEERIGKIVDFLEENELTEEQIEQWSQSTPLIPSFECFLNDDYESFDKLDVKGTSAVAGEAMQTLSECSY